MYVAGIEKIKFKGKDGADVEFCQITLLSDIRPDRGIGQTADVVRCAPDKCAGLEIGDTVEVLYNKSGRVMRFDILDR